MNKHSNHIIYLLILLIFSLLLVSCMLRNGEATRPSEKDPEKKDISSYQEIVGEAKIPLYTSKQEVIDNSDLVIIGKKLDEEQVSFNIENDITDDFTKSTVEVLKLIKPMPGKDIRVGSQIVVLEQEWVDDKRQQIVHMAAYKKMKTGSAYALYLGYNKEADTFYPIGCIYGKIPVDTSEEILFHDEEHDDQDIYSVLKDLYLDYSGD